LSVHTPHKGLKQKAALGTVPLRALGTRVTPVALVLLSLTLMVFHKTGALPVERLRAAVTDAAVPVFEAVSAPFVTFADSFQGLRSLRALQSENMRLREENQRLQQWYEAALKFQSENKSLHDLLNIKADPSLSFVTTRIVADPGGAFVKSALLPAGALDGLRKGSAVMSGHGLVGRVTETGRHSARVLLVNDLNSRIPVVIQNTRIRAVLAGRNGDLMRLERLPIDSGVAVGARVVTSGDGGQLPSDIPIGVIEAVDKDGVSVRPLSDIDGLTWVQVVSMTTDDDTPAP
jgi:rod shape-determining protein MreC